MQQITDKIAQMEEEMAGKFQKTDDLKVDFEKEKIKLASIKQMMQSFKPGLTKQTTYHSMKHDTKKNQLLQGDIYNRLNDIEKKLIQNESQIYGIQQYIESKSAESNYQGAFQDCMGMCMDINAEHIKKALTVQRN